MRSCFLFGHADAPQSILPDLVKAIENEASKGTKIFFIGNHGNFDHMAAIAFQHVKQKYGSITAMLVLPCHPSAYHTEKPDGFDGILYPPFENVPQRIALMRANQYMVSTSDYVICYVCHWGSSKFLLNYAQRHGVSITNIV